MRPFLCTFVLASALAGFGCHSAPRNAWPLEPHFPAKSSPEGIPPQAKHLAGRTIVLDPGHGGDVGPKYDDSGFKRGPTGLREAVINFRTSMKLKELLEASGATVILTRTEDVDLSLADRAKVANDAQADLFLSIHHNASSKPTTNWSSVWYHQDGAKAPASLDAARAVQAALVRTVPSEQPQHSGIYSDRLMYQGGFGVLRHCEGPAILAECSFFSHPEEEARLADPNYNDLMAYALFLGLCEWAANGLPSWTVDSMGNDDGTTSVTVRLNDGMKEGWGNKDARLAPASLRVIVEGNEVPVESPKAGHLVSFAAGPWQEGTPFSLAVWFENRYRNASLTPPRSVTRTPIASAKP